MKVKNRQHKCTKKRSTTIVYNNFKFHSIVIILVCYLLNVNAVNAYFNRTDALVNRYDYDTYDDNEPMLNSSTSNYNNNNNNHHNRTAEGHRNGKFLFDALFGIEQNIEYDDVSEGDKIKTCNCDCGTPNQEIRIVGGRPTGINQYPWIARLVYDGHFHCGASLISADHVVTAAHCVRRLRRSKIRIILGDHDQFITSESQAKMRAVSAIIRHRNFDSNTYNHDIALLKLRKTVVFTKTIRPVCLPSSEADPAGKTGVAVGWGRTSEGGALPAVVQHVQVPILTLDQCRSMKYRSSRITPNMLCAGKGKQDSCQGDSGGPLLIENKDKYEIVGIVSWGVGCGRAGYPGVYTRITRYLPWLKANLDGCVCTG